MPRTVVARALSTAIMLLALNVALADELADIADSQLERQFTTDAPGVALAILYKGDVVYQRCRGLVDLDSKAPINADTRFYVASLTKPFVATVFHRLAERGKLRLDDSVRKHLPELPAFADTITLERMLNHTSGVPDYYDIFQDEFQAGLTNAWLLKFISILDKPEFATGDKWSYSNTGYVLLAAVIERVVKKPLAQVLHDEIFEPLGMNRTFLDDGRRGLPSGLARAYVVADGTTRPADRPNRVYGSGGVYSTLNDLIAWQKALAGGQVLPKGAMKHVAKPARTNNGRPTPYSCGWLAEFHTKGPLANVDYIASFGSLGGYRAMTIWYMKPDIAVVQLCNRGELASTEPFVEALLKRASTRAATPK